MKNCHLVSATKNLFGLRRSGESRVWQVGGGAGPSMPCEAFIGWGGWAPSTGRVHDRIHCCSPGGSGRARPRAQGRRITSHWGGRADRRRAFFSSGVLLVTACFCSSRRHKFARRLCRAGNQHANVMTISTLSMFGTRGIRTSSS